MARLSALVAVHLATAVAMADGRPNVLLILADDLGYSDLGCYGGEIRTPNLDALAEKGLRFTQFYNTARCWPSRAAILTGYYAQQVRRDTVPGIPSGGRGVRPEWAPLLSRLLGAAGYRSYHSGKWHLDGMPLASGFDRSYHLGDQGRFFNPKAHWRDDKPLPAIEPGSGFYATTAIAEHAIDCLREHAGDHADTPFFLYLAFTAPHFPLHAKPEDIARYADSYQQGWGTVRSARFERQRSLGLLDASLSAPEPDIGPPYHFPEALRILGDGEVNRPVPWESLNAAQQQFQAAKMALHAAMIDRMDIEIGRVLAQLRSMQAFDNTMILFLSDNGASAEIMVRDDGHDSGAPPGSAATYLCLGPGWSTTCNTPFRRHKTWVHEGGIATPLIIHWPEGFKARGEIRANPGHVIDLLPTILDVAAVPLPSAIDRVDVPEKPGRSLRPSFERDNSVPHDYLWWAHEDNRAIRAGGWKLVRSGADASWELYHIETDRSETRDLAAQHPEKVRDLASLWESHWNKTVALASPEAPDPPDGPTSKGPARP